MIKTNYQSSRENEYREPDIRHNPLRAELVQYTSLGLGRSIPYDTRRGGYEDLEPTREKKSYEVKGVHRENYAIEGGEILSIPSGGFSGITSGGSTIAFV
mgnify:CR=1 FL=1